MTATDEPPRGRPEAVLRPRRARRALQIQRFEPGPTMAPFIEYHWSVTWDVDEAHDQQVLPQPRISLAVEGGRLLVHGVARDRFSRRLEGRGHAFGTAFRHGGFRPLLGTPVGALLDRVGTVEEVLGVDDRPTARTVQQASDPSVMVEAVEDLLARVGPTPDPVVDEVCGWLRVAEADRQLTDVRAFAAEVGASSRTLQRRFHDYVGVGPKWVLRRLRLLDLAAATHDGEAPDWSALAVELGFADQAHLVNAFTAVVGTPPASYRSDLGP